MALYLPGVPVQLQRAESSELGYECGILHVDLHLKDLNTDS